MRTIKTSDASRIERTAEITMFLNDARRYEMRSANEQIELCRRAKAGDEKARAELVHCNLLFMFSVCAKYANGNDILDLIGAATIGLLNSIKLFDENQGVNFLSYAVRGMQDEIMQALSADKLVVNKSEIRVSAKVARLRERFYQSAERYPSEDELMALLESEGIDANEYHVKQMSFSSFSDVMGDDDEDTLENCGKIALATAHDNGADDLTDAYDNNERLSIYFTALNERQSRIMKRLYGIGCQEMSAEEVAMIEACTPQTIRNVQRECLFRMHRVADNERAKEAL